MGHLLWRAAVVASDYANSLACTRAELIISSDSFLGGKWTQVVIVIGLGLKSTHAGSISALLRVRSARTQHQVQHSEKGNMQLRKMSKRVNNH